MCTSEQFHIVSFNAEQFKEQLSVVWVSSHRASGSGLRAALGPREGPWEAGDVEAADQDLTRAPPAVQAALKTYKPGPEGALRKELMNSINFARNFADDILLPYGVQRIVYLDADTIVQVEPRAWAKDARPIPCCKPDLHPHLCARQGHAHLRGKAACSRKSEGLRAR